MSDEITLQLSASASVNPSGKFEILAITAGTGNGWNFTPAALQASLSLWNGAPVFVDHGSWFSGRSVRDLAGSFSLAAWDEQAQGIRGQLVTLGPAGPLVDELGRQLLSEEQKPNIGFSADVVFTAQGREVKSILRVIELCLVYNPARGGAFVRALNSLHGGSFLMSAPLVDPNPNPAPPSSNPAPGNLSTQLQQDVSAMRSLLEVQHERQALAEQAEAARAVRQQICAYLLDGGLAAHLALP